MFSTQKIRRAIIHVSGWTFCSRMLGFARTFLQIRYLGASAVSDGFITAYKIPNSLRKIFAEGALSGVFVPTIVNTIKQEGKEAVNNLITFAFVVFEAVVVLLCAIVMLFPDPVIHFIAPGFSDLQVQDTVSCVRILMPFILLVSSSAVLAGVLQAVGHFFMPAFAPVLLNIVYITALVTCNYYSLPVEALCWFIIAGGVLQFLLHLLIYLRLGFSFGALRSADMKQFGHVIVKFIPCLIGMGAMEVGVIVDQYFASYLPQGSTSLHEYAMRFMGIPLGVFASALSTVLLPHFVHVATMEREKLSLYLLETTKLVLWVLLPVTFLMAYFSHAIFVTAFLSEKFTVSDVIIATQVLQAFVLGLCFFAINKVLLNIFYALHRVWLPAYITIFATGCNALLNWLLVAGWGVPGIALATSASALIQTVLFYAVLTKYEKLVFDVRPLILFLCRYSVQMGVMCIPFIAMYHGCLYLIDQIGCSTVLCGTLLFWLWVGPLACLHMVALWYTRRRFSISLYFLDE
jgi:putative peptidoglycan lipid II flippase